MRAAVEAGIPVTAIPGPAALVMAVTLSGLPVHSFTYRGFPPRKPVGAPEVPGGRPGLTHTLIFYESPYRLKAFLEDALAVYGNRPAAVANDLTKMFELVQRGTLSELLSWCEQTESAREFTVVIHGKDEG